MSNMSKMEYVESLVSTEFSIQLKNKLEDLIKYLETNTKEVKIDFKYIGLPTIIKIYKDHTLLNDINLININDNIELYAYNRKINDIIYEHLSEDIEYLEAPFSFIKTHNFKKFTNLKKVKITGDTTKINTELANTIFNNSNITELSGNIILEDDFINEWIIVNNNLATNNGKIIKTNRFQTKSNSMSNISEKVTNLDIIADDMPNAITAINKSLKDYDIDNPEVIDIRAHKDKRKKNEYSKIHFQRYQIHDFSFNNRAEYDKDTNELLIDYPNSIEDIFNIIKNFEDNNIHIDELFVTLENKDYENIDKLRKLSQKYNIHLSYIGINRTEDGMIPIGALHDTSIDNFIGMRETINYYKMLISSYNMSELEKVTFAYDLLKSFTYNEEEEDEDKHTSRAIDKIISSGKIVCAGYSGILEQLLNELGIKASEVSVDVYDKKKDEYEGHARNIIEIHDDKYNVHGTYAFDSTWDSNPDAVKILNKDNNEDIISLDKKSEDDIILKRYDATILYRYFLIPGDKYEQVFKDEKTHDKKVADYILKSQDTEKSGIPFKEGSLNADMDIDRFLELMRTVKLYEGFPPEYIEQEIQDIIEVNKIDKVIEEAKHR